MRIISAFILIICLITGCASGQDSFVSSEEQPSLPTQHPEFDSIYEKYIAPMQNTSILSSSWERGDDIDTRAFTAFYYFNVLSVEDPGTWKSKKEIPAKEIEEYFRLLFDASPSHLQTGENYNAETETYIYNTGYGSTGATIITGVTGTEDLLKIFYTQYHPGDKPIRDGILTVRTDGESFRYVSCEIVKTYKENLKGF